MNILQVSTYPIVKPLHGGQIRVKEIRDELVRLGHNVKSISFSEFSHKYFDEELDFTISDALLSRTVKTAYSNDLATALESAKNSGMERFIINHVKNFLPDYIFIEQAWLWPLIKKLIDLGLLSNVKVVYSSHNIEYLTKQSIFDSNDIIDECNVVESIRNIEMELCLNSDVVIGCTQTDLNKFIELGAKKVLLCPNGVATQKVDDQNKNKIRELVGERKYALFIGSAYPPNAQGFWEMLGKSMAWLEPDQMILAVGGCSLILEDFAPRESEIFNFVNFDKIKRLGFVENYELSALISNADQLILPITSGGGSNLKTAEAIIANKPVVATDMACRGYDMVSHLSNFFVCKSQNEFINAVKNGFSIDSQTINKQESELRERVLWKHTLFGLKEVFN